MTSEPRRPEQAGAAGREVVHVRIRRGLDLRLDGAPEPVVGDAGQCAAPVRHVALCGTDYPGLKPRLRVAVGDAVQAGQPLFVDARDPAVSFAAPGTGEVVAIHRGPRRVLEQVVVRLADGEPAALPFPSAQGARWDAQSRDELVDRLAGSGLWTALRERPFGRVPLTASEPAALFVTAIDTRPLAADPRIVIAAEAGPFETGLQVLARLTAGPVWLCTGADWDLGQPDVPRLRRAAFAGRHPAGLPGTHMHQLEPVGESRSCWHIGYQDVIAFGRLFGADLLDPGRVVALCGAGAQRPRLLRTRCGASLDELLDGEQRPGPVRVISGSALDGRAQTPGRAFLGRYHQQVTVLPAALRPRPLGWLWRGRDGGRTRGAAAAAHVGAPSGMLPLERFEDLLPRGFLAVPLLRALMAGDIDGARELGCLELDEEDLALCAWACPARCDYPGALRRALSRIEAGA